MNLKFKDVVDFPEWRWLSPSYTGSGLPISALVNFAEDLRNNDFAHPLVFLQGSNATLAYYNIKQDAWGTIVGTGFGGAGSTGAGALSTFVPSLSPSGLLSNSGNTLTKVTLSTALPASVSANQLTNRGDGKGFIIRIISNGVGGSGKIEERRVIANTAGTTPTLILDEPLSFTPNNINSDRYEFLSGSYIVLFTGALQANQFRRYDCLTGLVSSLSTTSLLATIPAITNQFIAIDESYVPSNRNTGEGFLVGTATYDVLNTLTGKLKKCLTATAIAAGTITGQASAGDAAVIANQYRNFQIRIVEDTINVTAVGQRRRITSHTAGASAVYTLNSNWTVTPSSTCKFVIENWSDNIIALLNGTTNVYNYCHTNNTGVQTVDTWNTSTWAAKLNTQAAGAYGFHAFGIVADELNIAKSSNIFLFRNGGATTFDILDISGASTGSWTNGLTMLDYPNPGSNYFDAVDLTYMAYNPHTQGGKYFYWIMGNASGGLLQKPGGRFDCVSFKVEKIPSAHAMSFNTSPAIRSAWISMYQEGTTKIAFWNCLKPMASSDYLQLMLTR